MILRRYLELYPQKSDRKYIELHALSCSYRQSSRLTEKSDVYSFGVVLLEIITSQPVIARNLEKTHVSQWVRSMVEIGDIKGIVDSRLGGHFG